MSWDITLDTETGDWLLGPDRDIEASSGVALLRQNIFTRLKIPRGSFIYDEDGTLGSRLHSAHRMTLPRAIVEIPGMVREALADMTDVAVNDVTVSVSENNPGQLIVRITYTPVLDQVPDVIEQDQDVIDFLLTVGA